MNCHDAEKNNEPGTFSFEINEEEKICIVVAYGKISFDASVTAMAELAQNPRFRKDFCVIVDLRKINYNPTYDEVLGIKNKLLFLKQNYQNKIALVTTGFVSVMGELVSRLTQLGGMQMAAFSDYKKALEWIKTNP